MSREEILRKRSDCVQIPSYQASVSSNYEVVRGTSDFLNKEELATSLCTRS